MLSLERCPEGMSGSCFFQKEKPKGMPDGTPSQKIQHAKGVTNYVVGGLLETQLALANLGCIAVHVWGSRCQAPRKPDWICFDLDPDSGKFSDAVKAALRIREALDALKLVSFPKTSGGKGLHIFVPIAAGPDCDEVLDFAERLGSRLAAAYPKDFTMEGRIANRKGRVYLDPYRNGFGQTVVSPHSVRRRPKAPFSQPLDWSEVGARPRSDGVQPRQRREVAVAGRSVEGLLEEAAGLRARLPGRQESLEAAPLTDAAEISSARDYYRKILPFYEKESLSRAHLTFWRQIARESRPRRILEIGAGLGRITDALSRVAPAVGMDVSLEMLTLACRRAERALFLAGDARRAAFGPAFDLIVAPGDPLSHMTTLDDRRRALKAVARQLSPAGVFVLEGLFRRRHEVALPVRRIAHAGGVLRIDEAWFPIGVKDLWHARYHYRDRRRDGSERTLTAAFLARGWNPATLRRFFASCGLRVVNLWGDFDRSPFSRAASRLVVVARRAGRSTGRGRGMYARGGTG